MRNKGVVFVAVVVLGSIRPAAAVPVSYTINLDPGTSLDNDVTNIMILEQAGPGSTNVDFPYTVEGSGVSVLSHEAPFVPTKSLIIGLTAGVDAKPEIFMLVNDDFAKSAAGIPFSQSFPHTRHSELISRLTSAEAGDLAELDWFANTFLPGDGAAAAFDTGGSFTAMEFTSGNVIGGDILKFGTWTVSDTHFIPRSDPNAHFGLPTVAISETATDAGPFDVQVEADLVSMGLSGLLSIDKTVLNNSGVGWKDFRLELGTGLGPAFVPSGSDGLEFRASPMPKDQNNAFSSVDVQSEQVTFSGALPNRQSAAMWLSLNLRDDIDGAVDGIAKFTIRQTASLVAEPETIALACCGLAATLVRGGRRRRLFNS